MVTISGGRLLTVKGHEGDFGDEGNVPYVHLGDDYVMYK